MYKLPVLLLDDFADISPFVIRQAYVEALYHADEWEYERLTKQYWEGLIYEIAESGNIDRMLQKHPISAMDESFTRPLIPFDCEAMGGCGEGTKRVPRESCGVDPRRITSDYNWAWNHN